MSSEEKPLEKVKQVESILEAAELSSRASLSSEETREVENVKKEIDIENLESIQQYGSGVQKNIASFADTIITQMKNRDAGEVGKVLTDLLVTIKDVGVQRANGPLDFVARFFSSAWNDAKRIIGRYEKVSSQIEKMENHLQQAQAQLSKDIQTLESLFERNKEYFQALKIYILAGEEKLKELKEKALPAFEKIAQESQEILDKQKLSDFKNKLNRFEKRIHDLKLTRTVTLQTIPQIRMIQNNNYELIHKIQSSILNTIPLWKNQIVISVSLFRQKMTVGLQKKISDTTNDILDKNSEMLKENSQSVAQESERGVVDLATLKKVNQDLIDTVQETLAIQKEGRKQRAHAEQELLNIEQNLKDSLASAKKMAEEGN